MTERRENKWVIDKHINISLIVLLIAQFTGFIWWVSNVDYQIDSHTSRIVKLEEWKTDYIKDNINMVQRLTATEGAIKSVDANMDSLKNQADRIESKIDRFLEREMK
jgi:hypothetical protein